MFSFRKMLRKNSFLIFVFLILMITVLFYSEKVTIKPMKTSQEAKSDHITGDMLTTGKKDYTKNFLYIVNSDQCIRDYFVQTDMFGDPENLDVLVLSYNTPCEDLKLNHVKYVFGPNTTWASGRNVAWTYAQKHLGKYLYYVFLDEDIVLKPTLPRILSKDALNKVNPNISILRQFENFLLDTRPAVGAPLRSVFDPLGISDFDECCPGEDNHDKQWNLTERIPMIRFDECFAAFHNKAIGYIMPIDVQYDAISWWGAGRYLHMKSYYYFHRQLARYTPMTVHNPQHKAYPQGIIPYVDIINNIRFKVPMSYRNSTIFMQDLKIMAGDGFSSHIHIHPLKPTFELAPINDEIVPFKYINTKRHFK
ncbi:unnamed protein product [Owenia fusiformis]|uniref:Uncharacterized protein n=1 Tax=Owenia fusiformis TaxID=6347 RepID=A0A8J1XYU7_OWEFU|nr:unnamed protein product [Owenia fusiformis]